MPRTRAFYSVLQYVPDGGRAEAANVGVALYIPGPGRVEVQTSPTLDRVKKFFSPDRGELKRVELAVKSAASRLKSAQGEFPSEEEFARFVSARADAVRLTPPRLIVLTEAQGKLDELYTELVGDAEARTRAAQGVSLPLRMAEVFGRLEAAHKVWRPGRIPVPETKRKLNIPRAYKNGRVNYVLPQSLAPANRPEDRLPKLGYDGFLIHQHEINHEAGQLIVLSADERADQEAEQRYAAILKGFHVRFVPHVRADEFAAEVEQTAH